jgi:hypothetical protein
MYNSTPRRRSALGAALLLFSVVFLTSVTNARASITYYMVNYAYQNGTILSGSITTDGTIGFLAPTNITGFSIEITPPSGSSYTLSQTNAHLCTDAYWNPPSASLTDIYLDPTKTWQWCSGACMVFEANTGWAELEYYEFEPSYNGLAEARATEPSSSHDYFYMYPYRDSTPPPNPWVLATIAPEPSTLIIWALLGTLAITAGRWRRRKAA